MYKKIFLLLVVLCLATLFTTSAFAQDIQTRGSIRGTVTDPNGANVAGATVTVTGAAGERTTTTNDTGGYEVPNLTPGLYTVRITQTGFGSAVANNQTVFVGKATTVDAKLALGAAAATVEVTAGADVDQLTTAVSSNLNDQLFQNIPVARGVSGLFYLAPGTTDGLGGGKDNPSISGGSALDNLYIADGVNITNSAFGGIGTFSREYGALGTGINTAFVKEVQVKTGGFEPQYGQSTGGIVNIITQSGGNAFHGAVYGYAKPDIFEGKYKQRDDFSFNKVGEILAHENYDAGVDIGGPILKDKLFFFGSFNPTVRRDLVQGAAGSGLLTLLGKHDQRYRTYNYAGKIDWNIAKNHTLSFSIFGDPTRTNVSSFNTLNIDNTTALSRLAYGSRNLSLRYNGVLSSTWTVSASYGLNQNRFDETGFADINQIVDRTGPSSGGTRGQFTAVGLGFIEPTKGRTDGLTFDTTKIFSFLGQHSIGVGYQFQRGGYSGNRDRSGPKYTIPGANADGIALNDADLGFPATTPAIGQTVNAAFSLRIASNSNPFICGFCPIMNVPGAGDIGLGPGNRRVYLRQDRGEYGSPIFTTNSNYQAGYLQDTWHVNRFITGLAGVRWEQEKVIGSPSASGERVHYTFVNQWAPRLGVTVDPFGKGKMKAYYNFGRFYEYLPLDLAERSLSAEQDFTGTRLAPQFVTCASSVRASDRCVSLNSFGTVNPAFDAAHLLNGVQSSVTIPGSGCDSDGDPDTGIDNICLNGFPTSGISVSSNDPSNPILRGTKLGFLDEHVVGFETQLWKNWSFSARYIDRRIKRIVEDAAVVSPEQSNAGLFGQTYFLANVSSTLDAAVNAIPHTYAAGGAIPAACLNSSGVAPFNIPKVTDPRDDSVVLGAVCFEPNPNAGNLGSDGIPDGFPDPVHKYRAVELEFNKRFADNWQLLANWRIASLRGNYEGHLRNDNGQTDPGISSLFDFTAGEFNLLGDQFAVGPLNSDRRHVINVFGSYAFGKTGFGSNFLGNSLNGLTLGFGFHSESGLPISELLAHPVYLNAGEIPVGGRGKLGRTPWDNRLDLHADYPWNINERMRIKFVADFFNITNTRNIRTVNQFRELSLGVNNVDFLQPSSFHDPFNMRLGMRFEF
jgi:Outer membrane receptor for ferrienterochelin and colicins